MAPTLLLCLAFCLAARGLAAATLENLMPMARDVARELTLDGLTARELDEQAAGYGPLEAIDWPADYSSPEGELPRFVKVVLLLERANGHVQDLQSRRRLLFAYHRLAILLFPLLDPDAADERAEALRQLAGGDTDNPVVQAFRSYARDFHKSRWASPRLLVRLVDELVLPLGKRILEGSPGAMPIRYVLGEALYMIGRADEAVTTLQDTIHMDKSGRLLVILGKALYKVGKADEARSYFEMAQYLDPKLTPSIRTFTDRMDARNDMARFSKSLVKDPKDLSSRIGLARAYARRGRIEDALNTLKPCVREAPDKADALQLLLELGLASDAPGPIVAFLAELPEDTKGLKTSEARSLFYRLLLRHLALSIDEGRTKELERWNDVMRDLARDLFGRSFARRDEDHVLRAVLEVLARERELDDRASRDGKWRKSMEAQKLQRALRLLHDQLGRYVSHLESRPEVAQILQAILSATGKHPDLKASMKILRQNADRDPWAQLNYVHLLLLQGLLRQDEKRLEDAQWQLGRLKVGPAMPEWLIVFTKAQTHLAAWAASECSLADELDKAGGAFAKLLLWRARLKIPKTIVSQVRLNLASCHAAKGDWPSLGRTLDRGKIMEMPNRVLRMEASRLLARALEEQGRSEEAETLRRDAGAPAKGDQRADGFILRTEKDAVHRPLAPGIDPVQRLVQSRLGTAQTPLKKTRFWANLVPELAVGPPSRGRNPYLHAHWRLVLAIFPHSTTGKSVAGDEVPVMLQRPEELGDGKEEGKEKAETVSAEKPKRSLSDRIEALRAQRKR